MTVIHDIIKIKYSNDGYLPNYPYHMISDKEMIDAFIHNETNYFDDHYQCDVSELQDAYAALKDDIEYHLSKYLETEGKHEIPSWVHSYMIGSSICEESPQEDKHELLESLNLDNTYDVITDEAFSSMYQVSKRYLAKLPQDKLDHRHPTMFGEPHVLRSLRILKSS